MRPRLAALALLCCAGAGSPEPPALVASATPDRAKMWLSESVRVTLAIEGPAPMRAAVDLPKQMLTADADGNWRIRPDGEAEIVPLPGGRERWQRVYRLDPFPPRELIGKPLRATFNPATVNRQPVTWPAVEVTVDRTGGGTGPLPESLPVTAIEDPPPPPVVTPEPQSGLVIAAAAGALACGALVVAVWVRRRRAKPVPPGEWARAELAGLEAGGGPGRAVAERVAAVLRRFVEGRFALPATKFTTTELVAAAAQREWPGEEARALRDLLDECDRAKFARDAPDAAGCRRLIRAAADWVARADRPAPPGA